MQQSRLLVAVVTLVLSFIFGAPAAGQEDAMPEGMTLDFLALATVDRLPAEADTLFLFRVTFAPGASMPIDPRYGSGLVLSDIERGALTVDVDGEVSVSQADGAPGAEVVMPGGEPFTLTAGDSAMFPARTRSASCATRERRRRPSWPWKPCACPAPRPWPRRPRKMRCR